MLAFMGELKRKTRRTRMAFGGVICVLCCVVLCVPGVSFAF